MMRKLVGAIALSASMATPAVAQDNPLVGDWFSTFMDPRGVTNTLYHAHFGGDGRLTMEAAVSGSGGSGRMVSMNSYQMTGPASYQGTVIDYEPKGMPPFLGAPGTNFNCNFTLQSAIVMDVRCGTSDPLRFTRQY